MAQRWPRTGKVAGSRQHGRIGSRSIDDAPRVNRARKVAPAVTLAAMRSAGQRVTRPQPKPAPRRKGKAGGAGEDQFSAGRLAGYYLRLCHNPLRDLQRWMDEDKKRPGGLERRFETTQNAKGHKFDVKRQFRGSAGGLRRDALPGLQGWLDAHRREGRGVHGVPAGSRAGDGGHDALRQVSAAGRERPGLAVEGTGADSGVKGDQAAIRGLYAAKIEATRRSLPAHEVDAAIRALLDAQSAAVRAVANRRHVGAATTRQRREAARRGYREALRQPHAQPRPRLP